MVWGRITTTKGPELGRACRRSTQVHVGFLSRPNGTELPERPKQAPRIPEKTDFCNLDFENRNYAQLRVFYFSCREGEWERKRSFFTCWTKIWAGVCFLGACTIKGPDICTEKIVVTHWSWVSTGQCSLGKIALITCLIQDPPPATVFVFKQVFSENSSAELE